MEYWARCDHCQYEIKEGDIYILNFDPILTRTCLSCQKLPKPSDQHILQVVKDGSGLSLWWDVTRDDVLQFQQKLSSEIENALQDLVITPLIKLILQY